MDEKPPHITGVILAAGLATRFGGDKLSHPLAGRPLYSYALRAALESGLNRVVMVCGQNLLGKVPPQPRLHILLNPSPQKGQSTSVRVGLAGAGPGSSHLLFLLADQPLITSSLINSFVGLARQGAALACLGQVDYLGPPTLIGRKYFGELEQLSGDQGAGRLLRKYQQELIVLPPPSEHLNWDVDRPADLARIEELLK